jgi:AAHS family 4-hydroxybenzoate transporter-like MFS transporter
VGFRWVLLAVTFLAGVLSIGAQMCTIVLCASFYETSLRATGVGWAIGIGRIGSIVGPVLGGVLIAAGTAAVSLFILVGTMSIGSSVAIVALGLRTARQPVIVQ